MQVLLKTIDDVYVLPVAQNYAKVVILVQSSGTGKFKTVDKITTEQILFPLCLHKSHSKNYFSM